MIIGSYFRCSPNGTKRLELRTACLFSICKLEWLQLAWFFHRLLESSCRVKKKNKPLIQSYINFQIFPPTSHIHYLAWTSHTMIIQSSVCKGNLLNVK
ncbi:hypothetical protein PGTUg99_018351 [Puccinia graminis f. sp. tritici]|uniref:Uncharacterized protein n=1 Tax=Puccinia graminis f. sp. tritici TaxID=56615 RepID=A0A5B0PDS8_PUCGR|nr:hypothetical protein PGTUg99_018351 [Puccinia graminis f. sp. tritici]